MRTIFIIGGMGAGKSTARKALEACGVPSVDLDALGHRVLTQDAVKVELAQAFGPDILDARGSVDRAALAARAFATERKTRKLNSITLPRIAEALAAEQARLEAEGAPAVAVEYSAFSGREGSLVRAGDLVVAVVAPEELRVARAVAAGWEEADVRRRLARQITDEQRIAEADVVFANTGAPEDLFQAVAAWWQVQVEATEQGSDPRAADPCSTRPPSCRVQ